MRILFIILFIAATTTALSEIYNEGGKDEDGNRCIAIFNSEKKLYEVLDFLLENSARTNLFDVFVTACEEEEQHKESCAILIDEDQYNPTIPRSAWGAKKHYGDTIKLISRTIGNDVINKIIAYSDTMSSKYEPFDMYDRQTYIVALSRKNHISYYKRLYDYIKNVNEQTRKNNNLQNFIFSKGSMRSLCTFLINYYECSKGKDSIGFNRFKDEAIRYAIQNTYYIPIEFGDNLKYFHKYRRELLDQLKSNALFPKELWNYYKDNMIDYDILDTASITDKIEYSICSIMIHEKLDNYLSNCSSYEEALANLYYDKFAYIVNTDLIYWSMNYVEKYHDKEFLNLLIARRTDFEKYCKETYNTNQLI